jgi:hypothetical protein
VTPDLLTCVESISAERLSHWRDGGLPASEAQHMREHTGNCPACHERLAGFERVADTLRGQRELEPGARVWYGVRQRAVRAPVRFALVPTGRALRGLAAAAAVLALAGIFASVLSGHLGHGPFGQTSDRVRTITTPRPTPTTNPASFPGRLEVVDGTAALDLTFAYVLDNDVWIVSQGKAPFQATHLGLGSDHLIWTIAWSQDHTELLANETADVDATTARAWLIQIVPSLTVGEVSPGSPVVRGCANYFACQWVGHRYIVHLDRSYPLGKYRYYRIFDMKGIIDVNAQDDASPLDGQRINQLEVRGNLVYYSTYGGAAPVNRIAIADPANPSFQGNIPSPETISQEFGVFGYWDLSADGTRAVISPLGPTSNPAACGNSPNCAYYFGAGGGAATNIFTQSQTHGEVFISPDGSLAATLIPTPLQIVRQPLPSGAEDASAVPDASPNSNASHGHTDGLIGWSPDSQRVFELQVQDDKQSNIISTSVFMVAAEGTRPATLVLTLHAGANLFFAPNE